MVTIPIRGFLLSPFSTPRMEWLAIFPFFPPSPSFSVFTGLTDWRSISVINFVPFEVRSTANLHNWAGVVKTLFTRVS